MESLKGPKALCEKFVRSRGSGIIGVNITNALKQVSNMFYGNGLPRTFCF